MKEVSLTHEEVVPAVGKKPWAYYIAEALKTTESKL